MFVCVDVSDANIGDTDEQMPMNKSGHRVIRPKLCNCYVNNLEIVDPFELMSACFDVGNANDEYIMTKAIQSNTGVICLKL